VFYQFNIKLFRTASHLSNSIICNSTCRGILLLAVVKTTVRRKVPKQEGSGLKINSPVVTGTLLGKLCDQNVCNFQYAELREHVWKMTWQQ